MQNNKMMIGIGLMSGTSLDGLDIALVAFKEEGAAFFELLKCKTVDYTIELKQQLEKSPGLTAYDLAALDIDLGVFIGRAVKDFCASLPNQHIDFIASHGHTVLHHPERGFSLQIGNANAIAAQTHLPVVADFRSLDIQKGGQGAPLVPAADAVLFAAYDYCLNLGGIANISLNRHGRRMGMDISVCNLALNALAQKEGMDFDENGTMAASANLNSILLKKLNESAYLPQKLSAFSLDKGRVLETVLPLLSDYPPREAAHTLCHHIARQVARWLEPNPKAKLLITGGGAYHQFLVSCIKSYASPVQVCLPDKKIIDFKEALVFAWLGKERLVGNINVLSSVTGANADSCSGVIFGA